MTLLTVTGEPWADYALLDSGSGRKLERYGRFRFVRPEPQAMWAPAASDWPHDGAFVAASDDEGGGRWQLAPDVPRDGWPLAWQEVRFTAQNTPFRHLGFFPDMMPMWAWAREAAQPGDRLLNLFGYTGVGTLALAAKGAVLTHVDASKKSVAQARANADLSRLGDHPVRWIIDDAARFTAREVRRGRTYHGIVLDPPKFGRGPEGEMWRLEDHLAPLVADCRRLLAAEGRFLMLTVYAVRLSALALAELVAQSFAGLGGTIEAGELTVREEARGLLLPTAIFARWRR